MKSDIEKLIDAIRNSFKDSVEIYTLGYCFHFVLILRTAFKGGQIVWVEPEGHAYYLYKGFFYDINGKHTRKAGSYEVVLSTQNWQLRPHRFGEELYPIKPKPPRLKRGSPEAKNFLRDL